MKLTGNELIGFGVIALIVLAVPVGLYGAYATDRECVGTVKRVEYRMKGSMSEGSGNVRTEYLVFTDECGVLENTDSLPRLKFDSSDIRAAIDEGETYRFSLYWWRFGFLSWYPNILDVEPAEDRQK